MTVERRELDDLLRQLVAMDSVNPSLVAGARGEAEAAKFVQGWLWARGMDARLQEASDDAGISRPNVVAMIGPSAATGGAGADGAATGGAATGDAVNGARNGRESRSLLKTRGEQQISPLGDESPSVEMTAERVFPQRARAGLLLVAHIDTVGAGDMAQPFTPREAGGRLYGRGALDIKSGVAAICAAAAAIVREQAKLAKPLLIAIVVDEECNSLGTQKLVTEYSAEAAVVLEPTDLKLCIAHKGYAWMEIVTHGRAAHGSRPEEGRDAIAHMGRVLTQVEQLDATLAQQAPHPLVGRASVHASLIRGGHELSSYPAECALQIERRTLPGESDAAVASEFESMVRRLAANDAQFAGEARMMASRAAYEIAESAPVAQAAARAIRETTGGCEIAGASFWTDTALLHAAGIPGVVFGPRGRGLHAADEYVELDSVLACAQALRSLALQMRI